MLIRLLQSGSPRNIFINIVAYVCAVMLAIVMHEYAHGFIALKNGDLTAKLAGRLTLNPRKHFDLFGFLCLLIMGFGWARPVPINPHNFVNPKKGIIQTSLAGVTANLMLFTVFGLLLTPIVRFASALVGADSLIGVIVTLLYAFFSYSALINIYLIAFNLLPIFPLDGFHLVEVFSKPRNSYVNFMHSYGMYVLIGLILLGNFSGLDILSYYIFYVTWPFRALLGLLLGTGVFG